MGARVGSELEARAAGAIATAMAERAELDGLAPLPESIAQAVAGIAVRVWSGPVEDRVRIADPRRVRAARFDNVFVASLQDGEFPRGAGHSDPFLSERQRESLGLQPRHADEAEERYLFHACLALPKRRLFLSYRDSDENGAAEAPSPFLGDVRQLLEPTEGELRGRSLAEVVHRLADAPSETELARTIAARGPGADPDRLLEIAGAEGATADRVRARLATRPRAEAATRAPGPLSNPSVIAALGDVHAYGGTTLEGFDVCSYRWFVSHELSPQPLDPPPDPLVQGGIMHAALYALYKERPGGDALPRPGSLGAWIARGHELVDEIAAARGARRAPGRAGDARPHQGAARPLPRRGGAPGDRGLRALAAGGRGSPSPRRSSSRPSSSTAGACTARSTGSTGRPTAAPSSSTTSSRARSPREKSSRRRRSCSCSST